MNACQQEFHRLIQTEDWSPSVQLSRIPAATHLKKLIDDLHFQINESMLS